MSKIMAEYLAVVDSWSFLKDLSHGHVEAISWDYVVAQLEDLW